MDQDSISCTDSISKIGNFFSLPPCHQQGGYHLPDNDSGDLCFMNMVMVCPSIMASEHVLAYWLAVVLFHWCMEHSNVSMLLFNSKNTFSAPKEGNVIFII